MMKLPSSDDALLERDRCHKIRFHLLAEKSVRISRRVLELVRQRLDRLRQLPRAVRPRLFARKSRDRLPPMFRSQFHQPLHQKS